jgi:hypothetical protein
VLEAGSVADDEAALTAMDIVHLRHALAALSPPRVHVGIRHFRQAAQGIVAVFDGLEDRGEEDCFEGMFHVF